MTALLLGAAAYAAPLVLRVGDPEGLLAPPVTATVAGEHHDTRLALADGGQAPDVQAQDSVYTALVDPTPEGARLTVTVSSGGQTWTVELSSPQGERPELALTLSAAQGLQPRADPAQPVEVPVPVPAPGPAPAPAPAPVDRGPWLLAALGWAVALALLLHRVQGHEDR